MFKEGDEVNIIDSDILGEVCLVKDDGTLVVLTEDGYKVETSVYNVCSRTSPSDYSGSVSVGRKFRAPAKDIPSAKKSRPTAKEFEYDLHAEKLFRTTRGIGSNELLPFQLDEVRDILRRHKGSSQPIVLIHGHGEGKLRSAILNLVKTEYPDWEPEDASFSKYGIRGAVKLRRK